MSLSLLLLVAFACNAQATPPNPHVYTNVTGRVLEAVPIKVEKKQVTFQKNGGKQQTYKLTLFTPSEQQRILAVLHQEPLPYELASVLDHYQEQIRRAKAMHRDGLITAERMNEKIEVARYFWYKTVEKANAEGKVPTGCLARWNAKILE